MIASKEWVKSLLSKMNIGKYSTNEVRVGTYIDGKPIYRKVITGTMPKSTTVGTMATNSVDVSGLNIDHVVSLNACTQLSDTSKFRTLPMSNAKAISLVTCSAVTMDFRNSNTEWNGTTYVTLEYTKTTD